MSKIMKNTQGVSELYGHPEFYGAIDILREHNHPAIVTYVVALKIGGVIIDCHAYEEGDTNGLVETILRYNRFCECIAEDFYDRFCTAVDYAVIGITSTGEKYHILNDEDVRFFQKHFSDECGITERLCKAFKVNEETVKVFKPNEEIEYYSAEDFCIWGSGGFCVSASFWDVDGNARCYSWEYHWAISRMPCGG